MRIEDLDRLREVVGSADGILRTLQRFGFEWDGEVTRQSVCHERYEQALESLRVRQLTFECSCSRMQLEDQARYPGTCRTTPATTGVPTATRLRVEQGYITFTDRIQGAYRQDVAAAFGDTIIRRRDGVIAYLLAVVVDDDAQGVTHVLRGADLLDNTPRQIYLQRQLGLSSPTYAHVPVLTEPDDSKLAKSRRSLRLGQDSDLSQLLAVFSMLGMAPPHTLSAGTIADAWAWAIGAWNIKCVPKRLNARVSA